MENRQKIIVIGGPTASGKTKLSIELAKKINGEIISADSMQIYEDMNIGTAKPDSKEMEGIKHYLLDCISPSKRFSVAEYKLEAEKAIDEIIKKGKTPIVIGGTGLYINVLINNIEFSSIKLDENYRKSLEERIEKNGLEEIYKEAEIIDKEAIKNISPNDKKRIMRILEIYKQTGKTKTELEKESVKTKVKYDYKLFIVNMDRAILYDRINRRVDIMINQGLIKEVEGILEKYKEYPTAMQGLGYKEVVEYLDGNISKEEMINKIKMETRRYAKRQLTWFRRYEDAVWLDGENEVQNNIEIILGGKCGSKDK